MKAIFLNKHSSLHLVYVVGALWALEGFGASPKVHFNYTLLGNSLPDNNRGGTYYYEVSIGGKKTYVRKNKSERYQATGEGLKHPIEVQLHDVFHDDSREAGWPSQFDRYAVIQKATLTDTQESCSREGGGLGRRIELTYQPWKYEIDYSLERYASSGTDSATHIFCMPHHKNTDTIRVNITIDGRDIKVTPEPKQVTPEPKHPPPKKSRPFIETLKKIPQEIQKKIGQAVEKTKQTFKKPKSS